MKRTALIVGGVLVLLILAGIIGFGLGSGGDSPAQPPRAQPSAPPPSTPREPACDVRWEIVGSGYQVPVSSCYGPKTVDSGLASGFTQNAQGAMYAAVNISTRVTSDAGSDVYTPTLRQQTVGDWQAELMSVQAEQSTGQTPVSATRPTEYYGRTVAGPTQSGLVTVNIAAKTPASSRNGQYMAFDATLQWVDGDWKLRLPRPQAQMISSVAGYQPLGRI